MEALAREADRRYTIDEWLAEEQRRDRRLEYIEGELYDIATMAGGTRTHNRLCSNAARQIANLIDRKLGDCFTYTSEAKVDIERYKRFYYPDASVVCGDEEPGRVVGSYRNPVVIVEVVSASSAIRDRGIKFRYYRSLASLRDYVLISAETRFVEVFSRPNARTIMSYQSYLDMNEEVEIPSLGILIAVESLYDRVALTLPIDGCGEGDAI